MHAIARDKSNSVHVLVCCGVFHPHKGGAESLFGDLCEFLAEEGHSVDVVTRSLPDTAPEEHYRGATIHRLDYAVDYETFGAHRHFFRQSFETIRRLYGILSNRRIDVVCIGLLDMSALYLLLLRAVMRYRLVVYLHGGEMRGLQRQSRSFRRLLRACFAMCDEVVAVSKGLAREAAAFSPAVQGKLHVIRNGFNLSLLDGRAAHMRDRRYAIYVGRIDPVKNVPAIVSAFAAVAGEISDVDLLLVGSGEREEVKLKSQVASLACKNQIHFLGDRGREEVLSLIKGAMFLCLASESEGLPIVVLEAFAAGTPVLAPNVAGVIELVEHRRNGLLFPPGDTTAMSASMLELATNASLQEQLRTAIAAIDMRQYDLRDLWRTHLAVWTANSPVEGQT